MDEYQTISQSGLVQWRYYLQYSNEINRENSISAMDQPLTLDEVRDSRTYPLLIHRLLEYSPAENELDYMLVIIHALMLENGFQMVRRFERN